MALCYVIGIIIQVLEIVEMADFASTENNQMTDTTSPVPPSDVFSMIKQFVDENGAQILCVAAGFMTASLIFSIGCFVTKYKRSSRKDKTAVKGDQLLGAHPDPVYANEGSPESEVSYACVDIDKKNSKDTFATSVKSTKYNRESYDFVERNRISSSEDIDNVNENANPYNHVTADMDDNVYDNSSFVKEAQPSVKDPTYSHISDLMTQTQGRHNKAYESHSTPNTSTEERNTAYKNGNQKTKQSMKKENSDVSDIYTTILERGNVGNTMKEKEAMNGNISNTHNIIEDEGKVKDPYNMNTEKDKVITANTKITEGYDTSTSSVMKEEDKVNETSTTMVEVKVIGENDESAKQLATNDITTETAGHSMLDHSRNGKKEEKKLGYKDNSDDGKESSNEELTLIEINEEETRHLLESDEASGQSGSDADVGNGSTMKIPVMAVNCLYEDYFLKEGEYQGSDEGSQEHVELQITSCIDDSSVQNMS